MNQLNKKQKLILVILVIIIGIGVYCYTYATENTYETENILQEPLQEEKKTEEINIFVHIAGCVQKEGLIELNSKCRISDAIEKAGGLTQEADLTDINLAQILEDGTKIYIPNKNEKQENSEKQETNIITKNVNTNSSENTKKQAKIININTATQEQLDTLPGIGVTTALKIIEYREKNGKFTNKEQLKEVNGIGDAKYDKIKEYISIK